MHKEERRDMFNGETYFKAKEGFVSRSVSEQDVLIAIGNNIANFNGFITLNTTASFLWKSLAEPCKIDWLVHVLTEEFDVSVEEATADIQEALEFLVQNNMVEVIKGE